MRMIRQGEKGMPGPGKNALPYFLALEVSHLLALDGRGLR